MCKSCPRETSTTHEWFGSYREENCDWNMTWRTVMQSDRALCTHTGDVNLPTVNISYNTTPKLHLNGKKITKQSIFLKSQCISYRQVWRFAFVGYSLCVEKFLSSYPKDQLFWIVTNSCNNQLSVGLIAQLVDPFLAWISLLFNCILTMRITSTLWPTVFFLLA